MSVTYERFETGLTYAEYRAQMTRNQDRFDATEATVSLPADELTYFANLDQPLHVLVLAEDWCGDVIANLPVLGRLAAESGKLNLRVFLRDQNLDLIDQYLKQGQFRSIPVFVFFDHAFQELGHWIERPARVTQLLQDFRANLFSSDPVLREFAPDISVAQLPEEARLHLTQANATFREENRALFDGEVVREIRAIVEAGLANTPTASEQSHA